MSDTGDGAAVRPGATPDVEGWWRRLSSAVLVGTGRRPVPTVAELDLGDGPLTPRADARPEEAALDAAALGGALRRAGRLPQPSVTLPPPAPADPRPAAPPRAAQLLELLLVRPPTDAAGTDALLLHWCAACREAGRRVPHRLLPGLLDRVRSTELRREVAPVVGERGAWLAGRLPDSSWLQRAAGPRAADASYDAPLDPHQWALLGTDQRADRLWALRHDDPAAARDLLLTTWSSDPAKDRRALLETLLVGLSAEDEDLLETALGDRAASVRDLAARLLDGLPTSRRAARMAERLRPLIASTGRLRRQLEVRLPDDPDPAGRRDGLGKPPAGRSARGWWLARIVAGAPYDVWEAPPEKVVPRIHDPDVLAGLRRAAVMRRDPDWARALLEQTVDTELLAVLPPAERETRAIDQLGRTRPPPCRRCSTAWRPPGRRSSARRWSRASPG